ncbi:MAG: hypothetical protein WDW36_002061 [Sanguina aurantia]
MGGDGAEAQPLSCCRQVGCASLHHRVVFPKHWCNMSVLTCLTNPSDGLPLAHNSKLTRPQLPSKQAT